jgi:hypothetical protein
MTSSVTPQLSLIQPLSHRPLDTQRFSESLRIIEPEIRLWRRERVRGDLRGGLFNRTNTECGCGHKRYCDSNRDFDRLLDGWHNHLRPAD